MFSSRSAPASQFPVPCRTGFGLLALWVQRILPPAPSPVSSPATFREVPFCSGHELVLGTRMRNVPSCSPHARRTQSCCPAPRGLSRDLLQSLAFSPGLCTSPDLDTGSGALCKFCLLRLSSWLWDRDFVLFIFVFLAPARAPYTTSVLNKYLLNEMNSSKTKKEKEQERNERHQVEYQKWFPFPVNYRPLKQCFFLPKIFSFFSHTCHCNCNCYYILPNR